MTRILEGTGGEIATLLQSEPFASQNLRVTIDQDEDDLIVNIPPPPFTVQSREHLIELLLQAVESPTHEVTEETWERRYERIRNRRTALNIEPVIGHEPPLASTPPSFRIAN